MKVATVIIVYNIPFDVFLLQIEAIRKFCKDGDNTIEVVDNSTDLEISEGIKYHSEILGLNYTKTNASSRNGSDSHSFSANTSYELLKNKYEVFFYLDHDCFPILPYSVVEILGEDKVMAGIGQHEVNTFMWPGCVMWRNDKVDIELIDFSPSHILGLDTGAGLRAVIQKYGKENCIFFDESYHQNPNYSGKYNHYALIFKGTFLHCINGSGWNHVKGNKDRLNSLINIVKGKINAYELG